MLQNGFGPAADGEGIDLGEDVLDLAVAEVALDSAHPSFPPALSPAAGFGEGVQRLDGVVPVDDFHDLLRVEPNSSPEPEGALPDPLRNVGDEDDLLGLVDPESSEVPDSGEGGLCEAEPSQSEPEGRRARGTRARQRPSHSLREALLRGESAASPHQPLVRRPARIVMLAFRSTRYGQFGPKTSSVPRLSFNAMSHLTSGVFTVTRVTCGRKPVRWILQV